MSKNLNKRPDSRGRGGKIYKFYNSYILRFFFGSGWRLCGRFPWETNASWSKNEIADVERQQSHIK